jgi:hypothetical protein
VHAGCCSSVRPLDCSPIRCDVEKGLECPIRGHNFVQPAYDYMARVIFPAAGVLALLFSRRLGVYTVTCTAGG